MNKKNLSLIGLSLLLLTGCNDKSNSSASASNSTSNSPSKSQQTNSKIDSTSTSKTDSSITPVVPSEITGSGTKEDPYVIYTGEQLGEIADAYNELTAAPEYTYYKLGNDIDLKEVDYAPVGTSSIPFFGEFDGAGHKISNLTLEEFSKSNSAYGLFAYTYNSSIHDVQLSVDFTFSPKGASTKVYVGGLVGYGLNTEIYNVDVEGDISLASSQNTSAALYVGGIAGILSANNNSFINLTNSTSDVDITCDMEDSQNTTNVVGGIAASVLGSVTSNSLGIYSISSTYYHGKIDAKDCAGGIAGALYYYVSITDCVAEGDSISVQAENGCYAGGIVGQGYYMTGVLNTYSNYTTISAQNTSTNATYKAYAGSTIGYSFTSYEGLYNLLGTINYSNYASNSTTITSDKTGVNGLAVPSGKTVKEAAGLSEYWSENNSKLSLTKYTQAKTVTVKLDSNYEGGSSQDADVSFQANDFDSTGIKTVTSKEFTREHYCYSGLYYDPECTQPYCEFIPFASNTTLYAGYGDYSKLVGTYSYVCSSSSSSITNSGTWYFDEDYFYWENDYEIIKYTYIFDGTYIFLDDSNSGSYAGEMFMLDSEGKIHGYDINDSDYEYVATKSTETFVIPDYTGKEYLGTWYFSNNAIVTLNADGNASAKTTTSTADYTGGYRELEDGSLNIKIYARINATVKYDSTNDIVYGTTSVGDVIFGARNAITTTYSSADKKLYIFVVGDKQYTIYNGELSSFTGSLTEGGEIKVGDDTYTVSGTTLTIKENTPAIPEDICGTYTDNNKNTMVLNSDGTGTWNDSTFTWTYDATTKKGKISPFGAFDSDDNSVTFNDDGTVTISIDDAYGENGYSATMTKKAATPVYVGTWTCKAGSNNITIVLKEDGTGTYNGNAITYTISGNTISISDVGDTTNITLSFDDTKGLTGGSYEYDYDTYYFSNFVKQA